MKKWDKTSAMYLASLTKKRLYMIDEKNLLKEIDSAMAFCQGFMQRLDEFRIELAGPNKPKRKSRKQEIREMIKLSFESTMHKKG